MADKQKWDIDNENFNYFFAKEAALMSESQRFLLPKDLYFKLFNRGGAVDSKSHFKLSFIAKLFILIKALRKRVFILIEDENGMDEEQYFEYKKLLKKHQYTVSSAEGIITDSVFVLANRDVMDTYSHLNRLSVSPAYSYLVRSKNRESIKTKTTEYINQINYVTKMLSYYESNRKNIHMKTGINFPEWLVLIHIFHGEIVKSSDIYQKWYKFSFNSSAVKIKLAFSSLQRSGYVKKIGERSNAKLEITALGRDKVCEIMDKLVINC